MTLADIIYQILSDPKDAPLTADDARFTGRLMDRLNDPDIICSHGDDGECSLCLTRAQIAVGALQPGGWSVADWTLLAQGTFSDTVIYDQRFARLRPKPKESQ